MKHNSLHTAAAIAGISLLLLAWQSGRFSSLASRAKRLERIQEEWVEENRKLESGVSVLTNRARAAAAAPRLGLQKARPDQRVRIVVDPAAESR